MSYWFKDFVTLEHKLYFRSAWNVLKTGLSIRHNRQSVRGLRRSKMRKKWLSKHNIKAIERAWSEWATEGLHIMLTFVWRHIWIIYIWRHIYICDVIYRWSIGIFSFKNWRIFKDEIVKKYVHKNIRSRDSNPRPKIFSDREYSKLTLKKLVSFLISTSSALTHNSPTNKEGMRQECTESYSWDWLVFRLVFLHTFFTFWILSRHFAYFPKSIVYTLSACSTSYLLSKPGVRARRVNNFFGPRAVLNFLDPSSHTFENPKTENNIFK